MRLTSNFDTDRDLKITNGIPWDALTKVEREAITANVENLQAIRDWVGKPIRVTSGLRTLEHNSSLKGASKTSQHLFGEALDFVVVSDSDALDRVYEALVSGGISLPHAPSQVILEEVGGAKWIHLGIKTARYIDESKMRLRYALDNQDSAGQAKYSRKLTSTEFLVTNDGKHYVAVGYRPYGDWV